MKTVRMQLAMKTPADFVDTEAIASQIKRRKSLHSLHEAWGTVGRRLTLRGRRAAPEKHIIEEISLQECGRPSDDFSASNVTTAASDLAIKSEGIKSPDSKTLFEAQEVLSSRPYVVDSFDGEQLLRCIPHADDEPFAPSGSSDHSERNTSRQQTPMQGSLEHDYTSPHVQFAKFHFQNPYMSPSAASPDSNRSVHGSVSSDEDENASKYEK